jgi:hypothetical protein
MENHSSTFATNPIPERHDMLSTHMGSIVNLLNKMYNPYNKKLEEINDNINEYITRTKVLTYGEPNAVKNALKYCNEIIDYFSSLIDKDCSEFIKTNNINFQDYL